jgi:hypothetical protein
MSNILITVAEIKMNGGAIIDLADPTIAQDGATKAYVDAGAALDFQGLNQATLRVTPRGRIETWTAGTAIAEGALVIQSFTNPADIRAVENIFYSKDNNSSLLGVSTSPPVLAGDPVRVMKSGGLVAALSSEYSGLTQILLTSITTGSVMPKGSYRFLDSGGAGGPYSDNESYDMTFDGGHVGATWTMLPTTWGVESIANMYDRFGIQTSSDGVTWTNAIVPWMLTSADIVPPWNSTPGVPPLGGWIFPATAIITPAPGATWDGLPVLFPHQYIKFIFKSDSSIVDVGWDLLVTSSSSPSEPISAGDVLYVDMNEPEKVSKMGTWMVGHAASTQVLSKTVISLV